MTGPTADDEGYQSDTGPQENPTALHFENNLPVTAAVVRPEGRLKRNRPRTRMENRPYQQNTLALRAIASAWQYSSGLRPLSLRRDLNTSEPVAQFLMYSRCSLTVSLSRNFNTLEPAAQLLSHLWSQIRKLLQILIWALGAFVRACQIQVAALFLLLLFFPLYSQIHVKLRELKEQMQALKLSDYGTNDSVTVATDISFNNKVHKLDGVANGSSSKARHTFGWMQIQLGWSSGICTRVSMPGETSVTSRHCNDLGLAPHMLYIMGATHQSCIPIPIYLRRLAGT
ncbi:hypothetical protein DFH06DRAFT_1135250 [Mycena polygramma]|nr:hypothetical protein DFH06DRAFT_1135250 [Mycena polygramma]